MNKEFNLGMKELNQTYNYTWGLIKLTKESFQKSKLGKNRISLVYD